MGFGSFSCIEQYSEIPVNVTPLDREWVLLIAALHHEDVKIMFSLYPANHSSMFSY